jgi:23S rRNA (adenine2503-C2)-methyltransferase
MDFTSENALAPVNYTDDNVFKPLENKATNFYSMTLEDLKTFLKGKGKEQFRAQQIFKWVYEQRITDVEQMTNLSKDFRAELPAILSFELPKVLTHLK